MKLIGLTGLKGSGKSEVAKILVKHGFVRDRMAGILKDMLRVLGLDDEQLDGNAKETPSDTLCGKTPRWAMQSLGTEWGRDCIGHDIWVNAMRKRIEYAQRTMPYHDLVIDDIRFPNEVDMIHEFNGKIWRIYRPSTSKIEEPHPSESLLTTLPFDAWFNNNDTLLDLQQRVMAEVNTRVWQLPATTSTLTSNQEQNLMDALEIAKLFFEVLNVGEAVIPEITKAITENWGTSHVAQAQQGVALLSAAVNDAANAINNSSPSPSADMPPADAPAADVNGIEAAPTS